MIPKNDSPTYVTNYRPISLANVAYKVISKILVNRLQPFMDSLVSSSQTAFVLDKSIQENSILAQELFHTMKHKNGRKGVMAVKMDMQKAYDRLEWGFILVVLRCFGFPAKWIKWIE